MSLPPYFRAEVVNGALEVEWVRGPVESVPLGLALAAPELLDALEWVLPVMDDCEPCRRARREKSSGRCVGHAAIAKAKEVAS